MKITINCPECDKSYNVSEGLLGKKVRCKGCGQPFTMAAPKPTAAEDAAEHPEPQQPSPPPRKATPKTVAPSQVQMQLKDNFKAPDPDEIMKKVARSGLSVNIIISFLIHTVLLGALSIGFIQLCIQYNSMDPRSLIQQEQEEKKKEEEERLRKERAEKAKEEALARAKKEAQEKLEKEKASPTTASSNVGADGQPLSKIEQTLRETSDERPQESSLDSIDAVLDL